MPRPAKWGSIAARACDYIVAHGDALLSPAALAAHPYSDQHPYNHLLLCSSPFSLPVFLFARARYKLPPRFKPVTSIALAFNLVHMRFIPLVRAPQ